MVNTPSNRPLSRPLTRRTLVTGATATAAFGLATRPAIATPMGSEPPGASFAGLSRTSPTTEQARMLRWARDTWHSMVAMTDPHTGLIADNIPGSLAPSGRSRFTSPTNIGGYLWSAVAARDLGIITPGEATRRVRQTLKTLLRMDVHDPSGMYVNWYDPATGDVVRVWPEDGTTVVPFYSSVDNGWLGAAIYLVRNAVPGAHALADTLWRRMRWDMFYDPNAGPVGPGGLVHGGFYEENPGSANTGVFTGNHIGVGPNVWYSNHHYDTTVSETRITTYLGLIRGQIPPQNYYSLWRTFPATCDWSWHEQQPVGETRTYFGMQVYEGAYTYRGMHIVPGWGGSMFEELMPAVFVPEESWAPRSWGVNHPLHVRAQREHGMVEAGYGYWGFSPSSDPAGGYREFGVDLLGLNPEGYFSDEEKTNVDIGFGDCRPATNPNPTFGDGVVTPHASFLAMMFEAQQAYANLARIETNLHAYGAGGFYDAVAVRSGRIAERYLSLDQAMVMGSLANVMANGSMRRAFATREAEAAIRPVIGIEQFSAGS